MQERPIDPHTERPCNGERAEGTERPCNGERAEGTEQCRGIEQCRSTERPCDGERAEGTERTRRLLAKRGICVIIPTYNNAGTVVDVVSRAQEQCDDVMVVSDGCTDNTLALLRAMPSPPDIIEIETNRGKGAALKKGFEYALKKGFAYAITLDADGQHFPEDIPVLLEANIKNPGKLIVGQRKNLKSAERSRGSRFANGFSNFWFALQTGKYLPDTQTGYRLYPLKKLRGLNLLTSRYEAELELMVLASWHGVGLVSVPVNVFYPPREQRISHFRPAKDFARISVLNFVLCILAVVYGFPLTLWRILCIVARSAYAFVFFVFYCFFVMTPAVHLYLAFGKITEKKKYNLHRVLHWMACFVRYKHGIPGIRFSESNPSGEDFNKPAVIICNHQSHLDLVSLMTLHPKLIVMTADWVWHNPLYRYTIRHAEFQPASAGMENLLPKLQSLKERGYSIALYPEGTRSMDGAVHRFHQGAFYIADKLDMDMVPVVIYGSGRALPKKGRYLRSWHIHTEIVARIKTGGLKAYGETYLQQASRMRKFYIEKYEEIANRIEQNV